MRRVRKIAGIVLGVAVVLAAVAYFGLQGYLNSAGARRMISEQASAKLGGEVAITSLSSGAGSTKVGVELASGQPEPLVVGTIRFDATPIGLALGRAVSVVSVEDATLTLHLDADNKIKDQFPRPKKGGGGKIPEIRIVKCTARILQDGKPPFEARNVDVTLADDGAGKLVITGGASDEQYGTWKATGFWTTDGHAGEVRAETTAPAHLTPARLKAIPFAPPETWEAVELEGDSPVQVVIGCDPGDKWRWHVECQPANTRLVVKPVGSLEVTNTSGKIVVDGTKVTLSDVRGDTAGGTVKLASAMDFGVSPSKLRFDLEASGLDIKRVPAQWGLANRLDSGTLEGKGAVTLLLSGGKAKPADGQGKATLKGKLFGGEAELDVVPELRGDELQFAAPPEKVSIRPESPAPGPVAASGFGALQPLLMSLLDEPAPVIPAGSVRYASARVSVNLLAQVPPAPPAPKPAAPTPGARPEEIQYLRANLKLRDVDLVELLARAKVTVPVKLAGKVTLEVAVEIPTSNTGSVRAYRATGSVTVPALQIEGLTLNALTADVNLRDGVLNLSKFGGSFPATEVGGKLAGFLGTARFGIDPRTDLTADLKLDRVPLGQLFAASPGLAGRGDGGVSGAFDLTIPGNALGDLKGYVAHGNLTSESLTAFGQKATGVAVQLALANGVASLAQAKAALYEGFVNGTANVPVAGNQPGDFDVSFKGLDAGALTKAIPDTTIRVEGKVAGNFKGTLPPATNFEATKVVGNLDLDAPNLVVQGVPAQKLKGVVGYKPGAIRYDLKGEAFGGTFDVEGDYPLGTAPRPAGGAAPPKQAGGTIRIDNVRLARLAKDLRQESLAPLRGRFRLTLDYTFDAKGNPVGTGQVELRELGYGKRSANSALSSPIRLTAEGVDLTALGGQFAGGTFRGRVEYGFGRGQRRYASLTLDNADAAELLRPLGFTQVEGRVSASLRSRLGPEVRGGGTVVATRAKLGGLEVSDLRIPLTWSAAGAGGVQLVARDATGTVANGRVTGRADITYRDSARVDARADFVDVSVAGLASAFGSGSYGVGRATGRFDLTGASVRAVADLNGTLTAKFGETTATELPFIGGAANLFTSPGGLTRFDRGSLVARLGGGLLRVESLSLAGSSAQLHAEGTVGVTTGRLDLDVVYNTGSVGPNIPLLRLVARNIPAIGPVPVGLIVRVSEALSNRVVRVAVGGSTSSPSYSVNATRLLTENAVRFFATQYLPNTVVGE